MKALFEAEALADEQRRMLLSGRATDGIAQTGPIICACFGVGLATIRDALDSGTATSVEDIGKALRAGTNCGSCLPELKKFSSGDFGEAWGGISSLQLGLPVVWSEARKRGHGLVDVVRWMAGRTAELVGLGDRGSIAVGNVADLSVFAPDDAFVVFPERLHHRNAVTPYAERALAGVVRQTWLAGRPLAVTLDAARDPAPRGALLRRKESL